MQTALTATTATTFTPASPGSARPSLVHVLDEAWIFVPELQGLRFTLALGEREGELAAVAQWIDAGSPKLAIGAGYLGVSRILTLAYGAASRGLS